MRIFVITPTLGAIVLLTMLVLWLLLPFASVWQVRRAMTQETQKLLANRGRTHGSFQEHARITQGLKGVIATAPNWARLSPSQKEALEMAAHKIGRILAGDPDFHDHWADLAGYSQLVANELDPGKA